MKKKYIDNGYKPGTEIKWFWVTALEYVLEYIKNTYNDIEIVMVNSIPSNELKLNILIDNVVVETTWLISKISWWNEMNYCTIFLDKNNKQGI